MLIVHGAIKSAELLPTLFGHRQDAHSRWNHTRRLFLRGYSLRAALPRTKVESAYELETGNVIVENFGRIPIAVPNAPSQPRTFLLG